MFIHPQILVEIAEIRSRDLHEAARQRARGRRPTPHKRRDDR